GDDHRDIYWRKSTLGRQMVLRERARETSRHVNLVLDSQYTGAEPDPAWVDQFEVRIREVASRAVAHIKRGDWVNVRTSAGECVSANSSVGADPVLRFLALLEPTPKLPAAGAAGRGTLAGTVDERAEPLAAVLAAPLPRAPQEPAGPTVLPRGRS
ncbi:MAG TPA: DUF58 domain-containing protein, partial [Polyangiaceae bacterium]|nr:DUF58 domain-containing protein [Polyangiaceae bacterium]